VDFETGLFTAQIEDHGAGRLSANGAHGGPTALSKEPFCIGINDPLGMLPEMPGACPSASTGLNANVFTAFRAWASHASLERRAIARGEQIFNARTFVIANVGGLNARPSDPVPGPIQGGTCTLCHDTPNAGNHSVSMALNLGLTDLARRTPDLPLYTLHNKTTQETVLTTDPGRAMVTGKWADIGKFKGPTLRALAARAPYFHNGSAATLDDAVDFYDTRFNINLTSHEKSDLVAFLKAL
jgi:cytochrome c peroxidase